MINSKDFESEQPFSILVEYHNGDLPAVFPALPEDDGKYRWTQTLWPDTTMTIIRDDGQQQHIPTGW